MKKFLVIGNPIDHSLSPKLHNYWIKKNNIDAIYEKKLLTQNEIKNLMNEFKKGKIDGINVTVPFKKKVIPFLDNLSIEAKATQSVNTIYKEQNKIIGHNTDIGGFELAIKRINYDLKNKTAFVLGAGGVAPSIIYALKKMGISKIILSNRTKEKALEIKKIFTDINIIDWGEVREFDIIINTTSLGLKKDDEIKLDYSTIGTNKLFYDVIYNPQKTNFLIKAKEFGNQIENGKMMFIYQAQLAFKIWHNILPKLNNKLLD